jgi:hypothetical protein
MEAPDGARQTGQLRHLVDHDLRDRDRRAAACDAVAAQALVNFVALGGRSRRDRGRSC